MDEVSLKLNWDQPLDDGGCSITGYAIYRDDGAGGAITTDIDSGIIANQPNLFDHSITLGPTFTGKTIRIKVEAINNIGSALSPAL